MSDQIFKVGPTKDEIPKIRIKDLISEIVTLSSTLAFVDFKVLMKTNPNATYFSIVNTLLHNSLEAHERHCPLFKRSFIFIKGNDYTFVDNFESYLAGKIPEKYVILLPKTKPFNLDGSLLHTRRSWDYNKPVLSGVFSIGSVTCDYMTSYPCITNEDKDGDDFTDDSAIYYMDFHGGRTNDVLFKKQFYFHILGYLKGIKNNIRYPDMPMELLQGIDEDYNIVQAQLQESYRKLNAHGALYR